MGDSHGGGGGKDSCTPHFPSRPILSLEKLFRGNCGKGDLITLRHPPPLLHLLGPRVVFTLHYVG